MEGMVNDLHVGREKQQQFDEWKQGQPDQLSIDLTVTVLTTGFWPSYKVGCWQHHLHRDSGVLLTERTIFAGILAYTEVAAEGITPAAWESSGFSA